jgi:uronate dehydrogenase
MPFGYPDQPAGNRSRRAVMAHHQGVRILLTGAAGNIGTLLRPRLARSGRLLRLLDVTPLTDLTDGEEARAGSVTDRALLAEAMSGVDAAVHLAARSGEAPWPEILAENVDGTQAVLEAAQRSGVRRVVLASSNHAVGYRTRDEAPMPADAPVRPDSFYGWSKAAGEALGRLYADRCGMDVVCLRIGTCRERPSEERALATWLSPDDAARLVEAALAPEVSGFHLVWGVSANTRRWWALDAGAAIGFHPRDDAEVFAAELLGAGQPDLRDPVQHRVGGPFCDWPLGERMG